MKSFLTYFKLSACLIIWSASYIWTKHALEVLSPLSIVFIRLAISSVLLYVIAKFLKKFQPIRGANLRLLLLMVVFEPFAYFLGETYGLQLLTPTTAAVILATLPLFTPLATRMFLKEPLKLVNLLGILISFGGLLLILVGKDAKLAYSPLGIAIMFGAVLSAVAYSLLCTKLLRSTNPYTLVTYQNALGAVYFLPLFVQLELPDLHWAQFTPSLVVTLSLLSFLASTVAFLFYMDSIKQLGVVKVNATINSLPMITAVFSYFVFDESLGGRKLLGIAIVVLGVVLSQTDMQAIRVRSYLVKIYR